MDVHSPSQRSFNMSCIKGKNTKPEKIIRQLLWGNGYRYRLHRKDLPGKPDIVFPNRRKVVYVHGCFWHMHGCKFFKWPKANAEFWKDKILGNVNRDKINYTSLSATGWNYIVIWECETKLKNLNKLLLKIEQFLAS